MAMSKVDDWEHKGPDDPRGDEALLAEALAVLQEHGGSADAWMNWEDFEAELDQANAEMDFESVGSAD